MLLQNAPSGHIYSLVIYYSKHHANNPFTMEPYNPVTVLAQTNR